MYIVHTKSIYETVSVIVHIYVHILSRWQLYDHVKWITDARTACEF